MLNLIKLVMAMALAVFAINASAYPLTNQDSWGSMALPSLAQDRTDNDRKAVKEHVSVHRDHMRKHWSSYRKNKNSPNGVSISGIKPEKTFAEVLINVADTKKIACGWLCANDEDFGIAWMNGTNYMENGGVGEIDPLEQAYNEMDKDPKDSQNPDHDVPEPNMVSLLALGLLGMAVRRRFKI